MTTFEHLFRQKLGIREDEVIQEIEVFLERSVRVGFDKFGDVDLDPADNHHLAKLDVLAETKEDEVEDPLPKVKRKYKKRVQVPKLQKAKKGKAGRNPNFDMSISTGRVSEAKEMLKKLFIKGRLEELEEARFENLCSQVDVVDLTPGQKDKVITLYKDVGKRLTGGE